MNIWKLCNLTEKVVIFNSLPFATRKEMIINDAKEQAHKYYVHVHV